MPSASGGRYEPLGDADFVALGHLFEHSRHGDLLYDVPLTRMTSGGLTLAVPADRPELLAEYDDVREALTHAETRAGIVLDPVDIEVRYALIGSGAVGVFFARGDLDDDGAARQGLIGVQLHLLPAPRFGVLVHEFAHALLEALRPNAPDLVHEGFATYVESPPSIARACRAVERFDPELPTTSDDALAAVPFARAHREGGADAVLALAASATTTDDVLAALVRETCAAAPARAGLPRGEQP